MNPEPELDLSIVVPVYNEEGNLEPMVERYLTTFEGSGLAWELVAVDDGSTDGSRDTLDRLAEEHPEVVSLQFVRNFGQSAAIQAGFAHSRGRLIALMDADLQTYPEDLPMLMEKLHESGVDAVVGVRVDRQDTGWKKLSSRIANGVRQRLTRENIRDTGCPIKVFRAEAVRSVPMFNGVHRFFPTLLMMQGFTVEQMPVRHAQRVSGVSKYGTLDRAFRGLRDALGVRWLQDRHLDWELK